MKLIPKTKQDTASLIFIEYRCGCGKLLFKGLLLSSALEIKCKRCDKISIIGGDNNNFDNNSSYSMLFDDATKIIDASSSAIKILGYSLEQLKSMDAGKMNFLFKMNTYNNLWQTAARLSFESFIFETVHIKQSGELIPVRADVRFITNSAKVFALVMFQPLQAKNQQIEDQDIGAFIAEVNTSGTYGYVNRALANIVGWSPEEMLGQPMFNFYPPEQRDKLKEIFFRRLNSRQSFKILPNKMVCKNGDVLSFDSHFITHFSDRAELRGFRIINWLTAN